MDWEWQSADAALHKARFGGDQVGRNPTDRGKAGSKRSLLVEANGGPLAVVVAAVMELCRVRVVVADIQEHIPT